MKKIGLFLFSFLLMTHLYAQDKGYVAISLGTSIPTGDFASKDANNKGAGFAAPGAVFDLSFAYKLGKNFGLAAAIRGLSNDFDEVAFANELKRGTGYAWTVKADNWSTGAFMFGGYGSFPFSEKASFDTKVLIGFLSATLPQIKATLDGSGGASWVKQESATGPSSAILVSMGFKIYLTKKLCLLPNADYFGGKPEFSNVESTSSQGGAPFTDTFSQKIATINLSIGIGLRL